MLAKFSLWSRVGWQTSLNQNFQCKMFIPKRSCALSQTVWITCSSSNGWHPWGKKTSGQRMRERKCTCRDDVSFRYVNHANISYVLRTTNQLTSSQQAIRLPSTRRVCTLCFWWMKGRRRRFVRPFVQTFLMRSKQTHVWKEDCVYLSEGQLALCQTMQIATI